MQLVALVPGPLRIVQGRGRALRSCGGRLGLGRPPAGRVDRQAMAQWQRRMVGFAFEIARLLCRAPATEVGG
jgi:hypothetical protein